MHLLNVYALFYTSIEMLGFTWEIFKAKEDKLPGKSWDEHFQDLLKFKEENGHTLVRFTFYHHFIYLLYDISSS